MNVLEAPAESLALLAWARVWSPLVRQAWLEEAWRALELPDDARLRDVEFCSVFHAGVPAPRVPLLLHAALGRPGDDVRLDWMRVMAFLGLKPGASMLPPDHLAVACEVYAQALARDERVLVAELRARYFLPWCDVAAARLEGRLGEVVARFREVI